MHKASHLSKYTNNILKSALDTHFSVYNQKQQLREQLVNLHEQAPKYCTFFILLNISQSTTGNIL